MTKEEAIKDFVARELDSVPQEWVRIVMEHTGEFCPLPMWGTMWLVDGSWIGEGLMKGSRVMVSHKDEIDLDTIEDDSERERVAKALGDPKEYLEDYIDEEMAGAHCVLDKNGDPINLFIYEVADEYVIGVNGAGWNFYDGVWDRLYDLMGLQWHDREEVKAV